MITRHYKRIVKDILQRGGAKYDAYAVTASDGRPYYTAQEQPNYSPDQTAMSMSTDQPGVIIGSGTAAESETSYWLAQQITSGFSGSVLPTHEMVDGTHTLCLYVTITNTGSSSIIISEIGYALITPLMRRPSDSQYIGSPYPIEKNVLIDRTVLASPITIAAGNSVRLKYALKTTDEIFSGSVVLIQKTISANGVYNASSDNADGYSEVTVSVIPNLQSKTATENGTVTPDQGYDGLSSVVVNVSGGGGDVAWNEPIVRNWDFSNPLNTRGQQSYSGVASINGWTCVSGTTCVIGTGGIYVRGTDTNMYYWIPINTSDYTEKQMTISLLVDEVLVSDTVTIPSTTGEITKISASNVTLWMNRDSSTRLAVGFYHAGGGDNSLIRAVKLEFGDTQTLAKQENGVWQLIRGQDLNTERAFLRRMATNF